MKMMDAVTREMITLYYDGGNNDNNKDCDDDNDNNEDDMYEIQRYQIAIIAQ